MSRNKIGQFAGSVWTRTKRAARFLGILFVISLLPTVAVEMYAVKKANAVAPERIMVERIVEVNIESGVPPIMKRIATCESNNSHYDKNGQVLINKTQDAGRYQINIPIWGKKATELGLNLMVEKDNEEMALWIYENRGTVDWYASQDCWNK
jgi:hypothetical protein